VTSRAQVLSGNLDGDDMLISPGLVSIVAEVLKAAKGAEYPQTVKVELNKVSKSYHLDLCLSVSNKLKN